MAREGWEDLPFKTDFIVMEMRKNCPTVSAQQRIHALVKLSQFSAQTHVCIFYALHVTQNIYFSFDQDTIVTRD